MRMPFRITNAPVCCQSTLDLILTKYQWKHFLVYLDDVIIFSNNLEDHIKNVEEILTILTDPGVILKINKCHSFQRNV